MCGIACLAGPAVNDHFEAIAKATQAVIHRGPDEQRVVRLSNCHLGHTRLSIIDLGSGSQPMNDSTGRFHIVFNGEIFNYLELREGLLKKGLVFLTKSDAEVILNGFVFWKEKVVDHLIGQFAFVIWDEVDRKLFAARDRMGEK